MAISSSVSRQSPTKPGQITSAPRLHAQGFQRSGGIGLQPFGAAKARLEADAVLFRGNASASANRRPVFWHAQ